jgi:hypothetical protein
MEVILKFLEIQNKVGILLMLEVLMDLEALKNAEE